MAILQIMNQVKGPLTVSASFESPSDGPCYFTLSGSVWSGTANTTIGVAMELDGVPIGSAEIFSNAPSTHRAVVPVQIPVTMKIGPHVIALLPINGNTTSDANDVFNVSLLY